MTTDENVRAADTEPSAAEPVAEFALKASKFNPATILFGVPALAGFLAAAVLMKPILAARGQSPSLIILATAALFALPLVFGPLRRRLFGTRRQAPPLRIKPGGLRLPRSAYSTKEEWIPFHDLTALQLEQRKRWVMIRSQRRVFVFFRRSFAEADGMWQFEKAVRGALAAHHPGMLERIEREQQLAVTVGQVRPIASWVLAGLIAAGFAVTLLMGGPTAAVLVRLGANAPVLDHDGQWFRLFTANFLHGGWLHLYLDGMALMSLGAIEQLFGTLRFLVVFLLSALGGSVASMLNATHPFSVGISTALFGLIGAWVFAAWRFRANLPVAFRRSAVSWLALLGINALISALPMVDWAAHLGGFLTGIASSVAIFSTAARFSEPAGVATKAAAVAVVAAFAAALGLGVGHALEPANRMEVAHAVYDLPGANPEVLNSMAWEAAIDPKSDAEELSAAKDGIARAVKRAPKNVDFLDTSATIRHRLGDTAGAVAEECATLKLLMDSNPSCADCRQRKVFQAQLARFLLERQRFGTTQQASPDTSGGTVLAQQEEPVHIDWGPGDFVVWPPASAAVSLHAYVLLREAGRKALIELNGDVTASGSSVSAPTASVPWPRDTGAKPPVFACVEWGEVSGKPLGATVAHLDSKVDKYP